jgi:hypothetical protein
MKAARLNIRVLAANFATISAFLCGSLYGQAWTGGPTGPIYYSGGNVGIGTSTPQAPLDIQGRLWIRDRGDGCCSELRLNVGASSGETHLYSYTDGHFSIYKYGNGGVGEALTVRNNGNVGIGTTNPLNKFHINAGTDLNLGIRNYQGVMGLGTFNDAGTTPSPMSFVSSSYAFLAGNVGIGTSSPSTKLSVISSGSIDGLTLSSVNRSSIWFTTTGVYNSNWLLQNAVSSNTDFQFLASTTVGGTPTTSVMTLLANGNVGIGTTAPQQKLDVTGAIHWGTTVDGGSLSWGTSDAYISSAASKGIAFAPNNGAATMRIDPAGNVGIGTVAPQYKLAVNGTMGAKEVIITATGWSDYVFKPDYRLRPLKEVALYIKANHHLPEIPSEAEVQKKGVSVGEIQAKLLAKVEELTLHMIQAEERNDRLESQNRDLQGQIREQNRLIQERFGRLEAVVNSAPASDARKEAKQ